MVITDQEFDNYKKNQRRSEQTNSQQKKSQPKRRKTNGFVHTHEVDEENPFIRLGHRNLFCWWFALFMSIVVQHIDLEIKLFYDDLSHLSVY